MTGIPLNNKVVDFAQLQTEMIAAGLAITSLGSASDFLFTYDQTGQPSDFSNQTTAIAVLAAHVPSTALHDALVTALTSSVGVTISALTQVQRLALIAGLLYRAGAIDRQTLAIKPLNQWLV